MSYIWVNERLFFITLLSVFHENRDRTTRDLGSSSDVISLHTWILPYFYISNHLNPPTKSIYIIFFSEKNVATQTHRNNISVLQHKTCGFMSTSVWQVVLWKPKQHLQSDQSYLEVPQTSLAAAFICFLLGLILKFTTRCLSETPLQGSVIFMEFWSGLQELSLYCKLQFKGGFSVCFSVLSLFGGFFFFFQNFFPGFSPVPNNPSSISCASFLHLCFWTIMPLGKSL